MHVFVFNRETILKVALLSFVVVLAVLVLVMDKDAELVMAPKENIPIYSVQTNGNQIALTFDAASGSDTMDKMLDILDKYNVKATFFVTGQWAELFPDDLKKIVGRGHEIGSHGYRHIDYVKISDADVTRDLSLASDTLYRLTGQRPMLFRAPYGSWDGRTVDIVCGQQYEFVQWDVDSLDWMGLTPAQMEARVLPKVKSGSILLFHNDGKYTVDALPGIIEKLQAKGFKFVTAGELIDEGLES
jgi:peptidoglycan-N-acetylglucosamine deacetylase